MTPDTLFAVAIVANAIALAFVVAGIAYFGQARRMYRDARETLEQADKRREQ